MRTLLEVKTEIATLFEDCTHMANTPAQLSRKKNRILFLRLVERYLETAPDELYLGRDIARLENRITALIDSFDPTQYKDPKEPKKKYEKEMGIPELRVQLRTLRFIKN